MGAPLLGDPTYAESESAKMEDRGYLHAAAIRIPKILGENSVQLICAPSVGCEWKGASWFDTDYFPQELSSNFGPWFIENSLSKSAIE